MKPKSIKAIGRDFENWVNRMYEEYGLGKSIRTPGSGSGKIKGDCFNSSKFMIECKSEMRPGWHGNIKQARRQAEQGNYDPAKWILVQRDPESHKSNPRAFAILPFPQLLELLKRESEPLIKEPDRDLKWKLKTLKVAVQQVLKAIEK